MKLSCIFFKLCCGNCTISYSCYNLSESFNTYVTCSIETVNICLSVSVCNHVTSVKLSNSFKKCCLRLITCKYEYTEVLIRLVFCNFACLGILISDVVYAVVVAVYFFNIYICNNCYFLVILCLF